MREKRLFFLSKIYKILYCS